MELTYNSAYHLHMGLTLTSGQSLTLRALHQKMTYEGLLEGFPFRGLNDDLVSRALQGAAAHCVGGESPYLIPPPRRDYRRSPGDMQRVAPHLPDIPEWLPAVVCTARLSDGKASLTVVWFQDEYALPIREPALGQLLDIDWRSLVTQSAADDD